MYNVYEIVKNAAGDVVTRYALSSYETWTQAASFAKWYENTSGAAAAVVWEVV